MVICSTNATFFFLYQRLKLMLFYPTIMLPFLSQSKSFIYVNFTHLNLIFTSYASINYDPFELFVQCGDSVIYKLLFLEKQNLAFFLSAHRGEENGKKAVQTDFSVHVLGSDHARQQEEVWHDCSSSFVIENDDFSDLYLLRAFRSCWTTKEVEAPFSHV